jgi:hypothetical protein
MAMRMLEAGGLAIMTDGLRRPDTSNVHGYYEFEAVKHLHRPQGRDDTAWLEEARGKAVKIVSFLLTWLPETHDYRVIFMRRNLEEVVASQHAMLARQGELDESTGADQMLATYRQHLEDVGRFLSKRACFSVMDLDYHHVLDHPREEAERIGTFIRMPLDADAMAAAVDRDQYRSRRVP